MELMWVWLSLIAAMGTAGYTLINQYVQVNGFHLAIMIKVFLTVVMLPVAFFIEWPDSPLFYMFVILTVPFSIFSDRLTFNLSAEFGGGVISRVTPLYLIIVFMAWMIIDPALASDYISRPLILTGICLAIASAVYFSTCMRKCTVSAEAFKRCIPLLFGFTAIAILNKLAMNHSNLHQGVFVYIFLQASLISATGLSYIFWQRKKAGKAAYFFTPRLLQASGFAALLMLGHMIAKNYAYSIVDDPTFPTAILLTAPLWIMAYYGLTGYKEKADVWAGLGVVASVAFLVLLQAV